MLPLSDMFCRIGIAFLGTFRYEALAGSAWACAAVHSMERCHHPVLTGLESRQIAACHQPIREVSNLRIGRSRSQHTVSAHNSHRAKERKTLDGSPTKLNFALESSHFIFYEPSLHASFSTEQEPTEFQLRLCTFSYLNPPWGPQY